MYRIITVLLLITYSLFINFSSAQVAAYTDYRGYFYVFDKGLFQQLEYLPVKSFKVGGNAVAYVDNTNELQIYYNGQKYHQVYASYLTYYVNENVVAYTIASIAYVFEKGKTQKISYHCSQLYVGDNIVAYYDDSNYNFGVYASGASSPLETSLLEAPRSVKIGSNLMAFVNQSGLFKIWYMGLIKDVDNTAPVSFEAGRDIVAYVDGYNKYFNLYYNGQTAQIDTYAPDSFKVCYGVMAYTDYQGSFRVFSNGATRRLLSTRPDFFDVKGNMILYGFNGEFRAFYQGQSTLVEDGIPTDYKIANDGVAYLDVDGILKYFYKGKPYIVSHETVNKYYVNNDAVWYQVGVNTWKVFYQGQNY